MDYGVIGQHRKTNRNLTKLTCWYNTRSEPRLLWGPWSITVCGTTYPCRDTFLWGVFCHFNNFSESLSLCQEASVYLRSTLSTHCIACRVSFLFLQNLKCPSGTECPFRPCHLLQIKSAGSFQSKPSNQKVQVTAEILNTLNSPFVMWL